MRAAINPSAITRGSKIPSPRLWSHQAPATMLGPAVAVDVADRYSADLYLNVGQGPSSATVPLPGSAGTPKYCRGVPLPARVVISGEDARLAVREDSGPQRPVRPVAVPSPISNAFPFSLYRLDRSSQ